MCILAIGAVSNLPKQIRIFTVFIKTVIFLHFIANFLECQSDFQAPGMCYRLLKPLKKLVF
jgi:hypothetical protein